ncbi:putative tail lysozyme [Pseudomonas phage vB_PsyM_KIL3b]|uniref:Putative tail lysozyme n=5 Tax=Pseudomonas phage vB_PsyM_KIL1 TaxID=1777065 RepID=A0A142IE25_9CAUD|nr:baseplate wedge subunit [Pseudomonas phage vB_PsyM_KIL1]AMR57480.1 putative tail lysozyme [Pseudomonas phage vB_PsyM_KIL2]AMR57642.1 putative tail lysozyme [Pseudomonas phage vB_PsyM_KIL3]AMR57971.1 putative tail lysozyme [Pseudomonas phage vB_PsyM_KIL5]AMR58140.1 putative tail lysozyme [Pseudomonas phage vB_PsyM_KIL3b]AMR57321.1 putative tail lysozyme [Pseudomonas phage vB_PsyM_KIL1]
MDLLLDDKTGDLIFKNGTCPVTQLQADVVAQRLRITLYTFYGEWFLNTDVGVPYIQQVFAKVTKKSTVDLIFQGLISADPGVIEILKFSSTVSASRGYSMTFTVRVSDNTSSLPITLTIGG